MNKELQTLAWASIPKEAREYARAVYAAELVDLCGRRVEPVDLVNLFGKENLTSGTEPEVMLIKSRAKIIDLYAKAENEVSFGSEDLQLWGKHCMEILDALFGDKCLPDKECQKNGAESVQNIGHSEQSSVQGEQAQSFNKGDKVKIINVANPMLRDEIGIIEELPTADEPRYKVRFEEDHWTLLNAENLEPYSESVQVEPKFNERDKVRFKDSYYKEELHGKVGIIVSVNAELECYVKVDNTVYCAKESDLETYNEPESKFKIGDKVRVIGIVGYAGEVTEIVAVDKNDPDAPYKLNLFDDEGGGIWCSGNVIEHYTESKPKFKVGDRMYIKHLNKVGTIDIVQGYNEEEDGIFYHLKVEPKGVATAREEYLEPYPEPETKDAYEQYCQAKADEQNNQTKDNMEEKEVNRKALYDALCELETASIKVRKALISI